MNRVPRARYTKEFREGAVKLAEAVGASEASRRLSIPLKSLANWQRADKAGKLELAEVNMERDLLKSLRRSLRRSRGEVLKYESMKELQYQYPVPAVCRLLGVSASGYYAWRHREPSLRARQELRLEAEIQAAHRRTRETCGLERLQKELTAHGVQVGLHRIRRCARNWDCGASKSAS